MYATKFKIITRACSVDEFPSYRVVLLTTLALVVVDVSGGGARPQAARALTWDVGQKLRLNCSKIHTVASTVATVAKDDPGRCWILARQLDVISVIGFNMC
jgi:hypothetical protein